MDDTKEGYYHFHCNGRCYLEVLKELQTQVTSHGGKQQKCGTLGSDDASYIKNEADKTPYVSDHNTGSTSHYCADQ